MSTYDNDDGGRQEAIDDKVISNIVSLIATCVSTSLKTRSSSELTESYYATMYDTSCEAVVDIFTAYPSAQFIIDSLFLAATDNIKRWGGKEISEDAATNAIDLQVLIDSLTSHLPLSSYANDGASK